MPGAILRRLSDVTSGFGLLRSVQESLKSCIAAVILLTSFSIASGQQPTTNSSVTPTAQPDEIRELPLELRYKTVPSTEAEIAKAVAEVRASLEALAPTTQPATSQPTTQPDADPESQLDGWRLEHWSRMQEFLGQLTELDTQTTALRLMSQDEEVQRLTETLAEYKRKLGEVESRSLPDEITDDDVAKAKSEYEEYNQSIDALNGTLTQQETLLREGFIAQRAKISEDLKAAATRLEKLETTFEVDMKAADTDLTRKIVETRRRTVAARVAALETARAGVELKEKRTQQELGQNKLKRDAMAPFVVALRERMNALIEAKSRSSADRLRARIEDPTVPPLKKVFYQIQLLRDETIATLQKDYANNIKDRFRQSSLTMRESMVNRDKQYWEDFRDSLSRRSSSEVLSAYQEAGGELNQAQRDLSTFQGLLDLSISEGRHIELFSTRVNDSYRELSAEFDKLKADSMDVETIKRQQEIDQVRLDLRNAVDGILKEEEELIDRLRTAVTLTQENAALWEEAESKLYWVHLITRGPTIVDPGTLKAARAEAKDLFESRLTGKLDEVSRLVRRRLEVITIVDWLVLALSICASLYLGVAGISRCQALVNRGLGDASAGATSEESAQAMTFARRLRYHCARVARAMLPAVIISVLIIIFASAIDLTGGPYNLARAIAVIISGTAISFGILNGAFKAPKPRYRLVPCSRTVARHYRRNGYALALLALFLLGPAILLRAMELAPLTVELLPGWFVFVATALAIVFLVRRETVLNVLPRAERGRLAGTVTLLRAAHPFLVLLSLALLGMHLIGYKALAIYITVGLSSTIALIILATLVYYLTEEFSRWAADHFAKIRPTTPTSEEQSAKPDEAPSLTEAASSADTQKQQLKTSAFTRAFVGVVRWLLAAVVIVASLSIWGVRPYELKQLLDLELWSQGDQNVTLWRVVGSLAALLLTIVFSRTLRQTLNSQFYPHHPAIDRGAQAAINTLLHYVMIVIGIYVALQTLRLDFGALAVLFGGLGLGIGLGLQPLIVNFISGLFMLFERHVKVGDVVIVHDKLGEVTKVSMRSTTIRTPDGIYMIVPNGEFINQKVENWTLYNKPIRGIVEVGVAYAVNPRRVKDLLLEIAFAEAKVLMEPPPDAHFTKFGDNSLNFSLACWFPNPAERWAGMLALRYTITERFREEGIDIPFPQRTLSLISGEPLRVSISPPAQDARTQPSSPSPTTGS